MLPAYQTVWEYTRFFSLKVLGLGNSAENLKGGQWLNRAGSACWLFAFLELGLPRSPPMAPMSNAQATSDGSRLADSRDICGVQSDPPVEFGAEYASRAPPITLDESVPGIQNFRGL